MTICSLEEGKKIQILKNETQNAQYALRNSWTCQGTGNVMHIQPSGSEFKGLGCGFWCRTLTQHEQGLEIYPRY